MYVTAAVPFSVHILVAAALLAVLAALVLLLLRWKGTQEAGRKPASPSESENLKCQRCGLKLMPVEPNSRRPCFLCPVCEIRYTAADDSVSSADFPDGFTEEADWSDEPDATNKGTFFGV